jgi:hypothetical protein
MVNDCLHSNWFQGYVNGGLLCRSDGEGVLSVVRAKSLAGGTGKIGSIYTAFQKRHESRQAPLHSYTRDERDEHSPDSTARSRSSDTATQDRDGLRR